MDFNVAATGKKNQPSHVPPLNNKPETSHPCVDHLQIHSQNPPNGDGWFQRHEADQSKGLIGGRPSPPATPEPKPAASKRETGFRCGSGKTLDWYSNSVGLGLTVSVQRARTHALRKEIRCRDESSQKQSHNREG